MADRGFTRAAVIGTGKMGPAIALTLALGGWRTAIVSRTAGRGASGLEEARLQARQLAENGLVDPARAEEACGLVSHSTAFEEIVAEAGLVVETCPEDMALKQQIFARLDAIAPPTALLTSNTSSMSITAIASLCRRPERTLTTHFWNPAHLVPLVEIVKGEKTADEAVERARSILVACGKSPVIVRKDRPGQLGNRLQMALVREAANIIAEGIATAEDIDAVVKNGLGLRMPAYGVLEHQDVAGLRLGLDVLEYVAPDLYNEPRGPEYYRELVRRGDLGVSTGKGFYDWSVKSADAVCAGRDAFLIEVLRYRRRS